MLELPRDALVPGLPIRKPARVVVRRCQWRFKGCRWRSHRALRALWLLPLASLAAFAGVKRCRQPEAVHQCHGIRFPSPFFPTFLCPVPIPVPIPATTSTDTSGLLRARRGSVAHSGASAARRRDGLARGARLLDPAVVAPRPLRPVYVAAAGIRADPAPFRVLAVCSGRAGTRLGVGRACARARARAVVDAVVDAGVQVFAWRPDASSHLVRLPQATTGEVACRGALGSVPVECCQVQRLLLLLACRAALLLPHAWLQRCWLTQSTSQGTHANRHWPGPSGPRPSRSHTLASAAEYRGVGASHNKARAVALS